jgi:ABC-type transport system involved in cytochrome c biogenesis permease subunit
MEIKYTVQGLLIYATIAVYLLAFAATVARRGRAGRIIFFAGFVVAVVSYVYRWVHVQHVPLQNLFEVFLSLGVACYPISWLSRRVLRIGGQWADMLIGVIVLFPAGFVFNAEPQQLPPALQSWLFAPHVAVYMLAYVFMLKAAFQAGEQLIRRPRIEQTLIPPEQATYELIAIGFPLLTLGLVLGSWWGKLAWGRYWGWDPKELWSLASWLVYVGYFHWRYMFGTRRPRANSAWAITGMLAIVITLLWVNLSRIFAGLHSYAT